MNAASSALLWMALQVFLFTLIGGFAFLILRRRGPGVAGMCATIVLALSLPIMFVLVSPWPRWNDILTVKTPTAAKHVSQIATIDDSHLAADKTSSDTSGAIATLKAWWNVAVQSLSPDGAISVNASSGSRSWTQWLPWLLAAGTGLGLVRLAAGVWSVRCLRRASTPIENANLVGELRSLAKQLDVPAVEARETTLLRSAATIGWRQPVVLLPADWQSWTETERRVVLAHELAHIARGDFLTGVVARLAAVVHFYQPLVLWLGRQLRVQQELAADGAAAEATGSQQVYLTTLAQMALRADEQSIPWGARAFLPGTSMLIKRVTWLKKSRRIEKSLSRGGWWLLIAVLTSIALGVAGIRGPNNPQSDFAMAAPPVENQLDQLPKELHQIGEGSPANSKSLRTLEFVPANAKLVVAISPSELVKFASGVKPLTAMVDQEMESKNGFKFSELTDMEMIFVDSTQKPDRIVLRSAKPVDWKATLKRKESDAQVKQFAGHEYFVTSGNDFGQCIYIADDRTVVAGTEEQIQRILGGQDTPMDPTQLIDFETAPVTFRAGMAGVKSITGLDKLQKNLESNPAAAMFLPLFEHILVIRSAVSTGEGDHVQLVVKLTCDSADGSREVAKNLEAARTVGLNLLNAKKSFLDAQTGSQAPQEQVALMNQFFNEVVKTLTDAKIDPDGNTTTVTAKVDLGQAAVAAFVMPAMAASREAAMRAQSMNNMKQMAIAMYNYENEFKHFPAAAIRGKEGKPLLSWRVAILPYLNQKALYDQFHLDEPWDSEHNKLLIAKIPVVYRDPHEAAAASTNSSYFMPTGKGMFGGNEEGWKVEKIIDGTALTIMVVDAVRDIPWTKPEDIEIDSDPSKPLPRLGGHLQSGDVFGAAFADGHVEIISNEADPKTLRACFTIDGREPVDMGKLNTPVPRKSSDSNPPAGTSGINSMKIEFRLAENEPSAGLSEATAQDSPGVKVYLHPEATLTNADIESATATIDTLGKPVVSVSFTTQGAEKMAKLTEENLGKPMVIMVDGKVLSAPKIQSKITAGKAQISGSFSREEAEQIAKGISGK